MATLAQYYTIILKKIMRSYTKLAILAPLLFVTACSKPPQKKNVLFILIDDFGYNDMSFRNSDFYETSNIDQLAKESTVFNEGYANSRVCSPSRASIMTGKFTARHGITDWIGAPTGKEWRKKGRFSKLLPAKYIKNLPEENITLAEALKQSGYSTFFAGKWHLGEEGSWPEDHGFDINIAGFGAGSPPGGYFSPFNNPKLKNNIEGENLSMRLAEETAKFIKNNKEKPFFAFLSFYAVHGPIQTTQNKWQKYREKAKENGIRNSGYAMGHFLPIRQVQDNPIYGGLVENVDDAVGHILSSLEEMGLDKNTLIVFTSDNGGVASGDNYSTSNLPLRGGKGYQFEGGIKEPYFIKAPWIKNTIKETNIPVTGADLYPTILDLVDAKLMPEQHIDGLSLKSIIQGDSLEERPLIWHYPHYGNQGGEPSSIIRKGKWKMIHYYEDKRNELYNLEQDQAERNDISLENKALTKSMLNELFNYLDDVGAKYPVKDPSYDQNLEQNYLNKIATEKLRHLEIERLKILEPNFKPNNDWWGSQITKD